MVGEELHKLKVTSCDIRCMLVFPATLPACDLGDWSLFTSPPEGFQLSRSCACAMSFHMIVEEGLMVRGCQCSIPDTRLLAVIF
jgi:hypothetical protein